MKRIVVTMCVSAFTLGAPAFAQLAGYEVVTLETAVDSTPLKQLIVPCPKEKKVTGGGWAALDSTGAILEGQATTNQPAFDGSHWLVNVKNQSGFSPEWKLKAWAICANVRRR